MKFGRIVLQVNMRPVTESDFRFDVIISKCNGDDVISRRKVLSPGECVKTKSKRHAPAAYLFVFTL